MKDKVYIISYIGNKVFTGRQIIGFVSEFDIDLIARIVKAKHNVNLCNQYPDDYAPMGGNHWTFFTDDEDVNVDIEAVYKL